jgi:folate-binding protein YgfZ
MTAHFGDPYKEQELYEAGQAIHPASIGVVTVSGPDRLSWLTTLSTQIVSDGTEMLLLDVQGRIEHGAAVIDDGDTAYLLTEGDASALEAYLESMKFALRVDVADRSADFDVFETVNENAITPGLLHWDDPWPGKGARYFTGKHPAEQWKRRIYLMPDGLSAEGRGLASRHKAGDLAAEATRVASWRPSLLREVDERTMPSELDWLRTAVHLDKGCYKGQESVARIVNLGKPPRRLTFLHLDGSAEELPQPGDTVELDGRKVGTITSSARHYEMGPIALALLKRNLDPNAELIIGSVAAAQELIVPVDGKSDASPKTRPGAGLKVLRRPE